MGHATEKEYGLAPSDLKGHQCIKVCPENHPDRSCPANTERKRNPLIDPLGEQQVTENRTNRRRQRKDSGGRYRWGRLKPLEHQDKVSAHQTAQKQVTP